ncbi:[Pyruvate dehydrogenase (acetyl-transferring)] kinase 2, mitochondrial [[Candida] jaroonii]|uniref:[Pyruvate dehydrogenase (Acetyl-transferring)] kinase 2, mitochondrial n=1 Tax=[Candida] jaroonii TaxID=467808 RepID=A0ACA9YCB4_9ASCO|nr:[Pyruvate dehydrogenase (acetyl-transferring)] kinase 2, mitochondrial [[Candida] jaroonii]
MIRTKTVRPVVPLVRLQSSITPISYIDDDFLSSSNKQEIAKYLKNLGPFPTYSNILNPQHFYQNEVLMKYLKMNPHPVSLRQLAAFGKKLTKEKILSSANFVRLELPIRLAIRIRDLQTLPFGIVNNFHFSQIYESYYHSFNAFRKMPKITNIQEHEKFCKQLSIMLDDHVFNLSHLMMGALEVSILENFPQKDLDEFMSSMIRSRISRRVIIEEHLSLAENYNKPQSVKPPDYIGEMFDDCNAVDHLKIVSELIKNSMTDIYPNKETMPDLEIEGDSNVSFPFMIPHLHYLFGEILRNSYEAVIKRHGKLTTKKLPPIKITIIDSAKQIIIRISDEGGGISHDKLKDIWSFGKNPELARKSLANFHRIPGLQLYSNLKVTSSGSSIIDKTSLLETAVGDINSSTSTKTKTSTLERLITRPYEYKLGLGLPMCKVYADYWNGDLQMNSLEGFGCDTSLIITKLGYHSQTNQLDRA